MLMSIFSLQVTGIHQQTVEMYLEDIYLETINRSADDEARKYVQQLARTINDAAFVMEKKYVLIISSAIAIRVQYIYTKNPSFQQHERRRQG